MFPAMVSRRLLPVLALLLLAPFATSAASATDHCVVDTKTRDYVCYGQEWCDQNLNCGVPICVDDTMRVCVNESPDDRAEGCVISPTSEMGFVCYGQKWCDAGMCATPVCLTDERKICVLNP